MTRRKLETLEDHKEAIEHALETVGHYTHNILGLVLVSASDKFGIPAANALLAEFDLGRHGFNPVDDGSPKAA